MVLTFDTFKMFKKQIFLKQCSRSACFHTQLYYTVILLSLCVFACDAGTENLTTNHYSTISSSSSSSSNSSAQSNGSAATSGGSQHAGTRTILRIYDECSRLENDFVPCLKKKAIFFLDRLAHIDAITVADGIKLVRLTGAPATSLNSVHFGDNELESSLSSTSRSNEDRDTKLTNMLIERLSQFLRGHSLHVNFPKLTSEEIGRGLDEGRGKMKKMMGMMVMGMAMKMMGMIPVAMGMLYMMAGKALIVSKIALLLAGIMGIKKLMSGRGGSSSSAGYSSGGSGGWSSGGGGGGGGGWDRRSLPEAQDLAYGSYKQYQQQYQQQQPKPLPLNLQQELHISKTKMEKS